MTMPAVKSNVTGVNCDLISMSIIGLWMTGTLIRDEELLRDHKIRVFSTTVSFL